jgi:hypothetical protein
MRLFRSIGGVSLRANHIAVTVPIAAAVIVAVGSDCRGSRRSVGHASIDAPADRRPCDRPISIAASRISSPGNTVSTAMYGAAAVGNMTSTPVAAATAPTCEGVIGHEADTDQNDC